MKKKLIRVVSLLLVAVMAFSLCSCSIDVEDEEVIRATKHIPQTKQEIFQYFCDAIEKAKAEKPKVDYSVKENAKSPECENSHVKEAFLTISKLMTEGSSKRKGLSAEYGKDNSEIIPSTMFDLSDIRSADIIDIDDPTSRSYTVIFTIWEEDDPAEKDDSVFSKFYKIAPKEDILSEMEKASAYFTVNHYESQYKSGRITAVISKEFDTITELHLDRSVIVSTEITGQGSFESVGTAPLSFTYESTENYNFDWDNPATKEVEPLAPESK